MDNKGDNSSVCAGTTGAVTTVEGFLEGSYAGGTGRGKTTDGLGTGEPGGTVGGGISFNCF